MADKKLSNGTSNKLAMSRALGAAFLNHQVEQLEKTVSSNGGPASGNWRDRKTPNSNNQYGSPSTAKRGAPSAPNPPGAKLAQSQKKGTSPRDKKDKDFDRNIIQVQRRTFDEGREREKDKDKDADVVVVDASVLIHALYQVKKWCRDGREEIVIVPLEALNTLDLLKKGTTSLAQKARAASRILEAQVGSNPRIRVQRDDAFVLWDKIAFNDADESTKQANPLPCPEWVRRIICCARWEMENAEEELKAPTAPVPTTTTTTNKPKPSERHLKVVLATLSVPPHLSPQSLSAKLASELSITAETPSPLTPVPLPAPTSVYGSSAHGGNRFEQRSTGTLVSSWAAKANIEVIGVDPALPGRGEHQHADDDRERTTKRGGGGSRGRRPSTGEHGHGGGGGGHGGGGGRPGLVERPPAVMAMMEMVSQPSKVVRVLARGEKLDPDP